MAAEYRATTIKIIDYCMIRFVAGEQPTFREISAHIGLNRIATVETMYRLRKTGVIETARRGKEAVVTKIAKFPRKVPKSRAPGAKTTTDEKRFMEAMSDAARILRRNGPMAAKALHLELAALGYGSMASHMACARLNQYKVLKTRVGRGMHAERALYEAKPLLDVLFPPKSIPRPDHPVLCKPWRFSRGFAQRSAFWKRSDDEQGAYLARRATLAESLLATHAANSQAPSTAPPTGIAEAKMFVVTAASRPGEYNSAGGMRHAPVRRIEVAEIVAPEGLAEMLAQRAAELRGVA